MSNENASNTEINVLFKHGFGQVYRNRRPAKNIKEV